MTLGQRVNHFQWDPFKELPELAEGQQYAVALPGQPVQAIGRMDKTALKEYLAFNYPLLSQGERLAVVRVVPLGSS